ncbi:MAG TPA: heavy metal-binding domain-containing protein, partial [Polyangiaceae bacterium]|nr:heavy metal-binding domain-containing protein [Polyangiaceae bacterium]
MPAHPFLPDRPVDEAQSMQILAQGGLPIRAQRRIYETHAPDAPPMFTSTLSPTETVVAKLTGLEPVSQVMGSSVYHVGYRGSYDSWGGGELQQLTLAYEQARSRALSRMQQEAALLRAHAVVDVRFLARDYEWADEMLEFTAVGTAVRIQGAAPPQQPALTLLSADELWKLHRAGYWPVAIAMGNCFWYARHADCFGEGSYYSSELPTHTEASSSARNLALERFRGFARHFNAHGVVGVRVERDGRDSEWEVNDTEHTSFSLDLVVMGTAVVRRGNAEPAPRP